MESHKVRMKQTMLFVQMSFSFWHVEDDVNVDFRVISSKLYDTVDAENSYFRGKFTRVHIGISCVIRSNKKIMHFCKSLFAAFFDCKSIRDFINMY